MIILLPKSDNRLLITIFMDIWVALTYGLFMLAMGIGWIACWRSGLPWPQKVFWSVVILIFPIAGTLVYFLAANDSQELFQ